VFPAKKAGQAVRMVLQQSSHQQLLESFDPGGIGFGFLTHWMV